MDEDYDGAVKTTATWPSGPERAKTIRRTRIDPQTPTSPIDTQAPSKTKTGIHSEHGHHLTKIRPLIKHSGSSVVTFFNGLFTTMIALATLGTSITFSFVLQGTTPTKGTHYTEDDVQFFLALSWLLFLLLLAVAATASTLLTFFGKHWTHDWDGEHGRHSQITVQVYAFGVSALMGGLAVAAFVFMCLIVVAYQPGVGWTSLGFTSFFGIIVIIGLVNQAPWPWIRARTPTMPQSESDSIA